MREWVNGLENLFASSFLRKYENPLLSCRSSKYDAVKNAGLVLLNLVKSEQEKYVSSQKGRAELVRSVTGGGAFSNDDHLLNLSEERRDGKKDQDTAYESKLKVLVSDLKVTDKRLILRAKITGA